MSLIRVVKLTAAAFLAAGVFGLVLSDAAEAAGKKEDAKKYTEVLKTTKDAKKKVEAIEELGKIGQVQKSLAEPALPDIVAALEDKDAGVRKAAAEAYGKCDPDPKDAVPALTKLLKDDKDMDVRISAARGLAAMGDSAKDAMKDLREVIKAEGKTSDGKQTKIGRAAGEALRAIQPKKK